VVLMAENLFLKLIAWKGKVDNEKATERKAWELLWRLAQCEDTLWIKRAACNMAKSEEGTRNRLAKSGA
jgi:hypothetical protein